MAKQPVFKQTTAARHPVIHRGHAQRLANVRVTPPRISQSVTVSWQWTDQTNGNISWTFVNSDQSNSHSVVLYRNGYIFGGAFWPVYLGPDDTVSHMLDGSQSIPNLSGNGGQPMGLLDFGPGASPRYIVAFIFTLGPGQSFSTPEGGFNGITPTAGACYELVSNVTGNYCVGFDPQRVTDWDNQTSTSDRGYSPNPNTFFTYAFTPEPTTPEVTLGYNDSIAAGGCVPQNFYFVMEKNNFGRDEVNDTLSYHSFMLFLEGFTPNAVGGSLPSFSGSFSSSNIPGLSISAPTVTFDVGNTGAGAATPQRIRFAYDVTFTSQSLSVFPPQGAAPKPFHLQASISVQGQAQTNTPQAEFFLLGGDDPYFTNVKSESGTEFYLSQDLRVFTGTPALNNTPISGPGAPTLADSTQGAYDYITSLITWLNQQIGYLNPNFTPPDTNIFDPLDSLLPNQGGALLGDSTVNWKTNGQTNYNFAIARVRLKGASGSAAAANNVKVFFRLNTTQTFDTDYINTTSAVSNADPNVTYPSTGPLNDPQSPLPGTDGNGSINGCSLPFFATANFDNSPTDYNSGGANNQTIAIPSGQDYAWAFYGCFLNVYDGLNLYGGLPPQVWLAGGVHNCLVAQIACQDAPILNSGGVVASPENSDKLAQRNLQVNPSGNPGFPVTHRIPQTMDVRPSPPAQSNNLSSILSYPDEMMIDWGKVPKGSVASIYWPGVSASSVVSMAAQLYPELQLTAADANTIQCKVVSPVTYIPIPRGAGGSFAGLFTLDLPQGITVGNEFEVLVRRITTRQVVQAPPPPVPRVQAHQANAPQAHVPTEYLWRYITGSFLVKIPVQKESTILPGEENLLAVLKWRLSQITPGNRWYPVLLRYIDYVSGRVKGMGGDPGKIPGSPAGYQPPPTHGGGRGAEHCYTGKVMSLFYDRFGDFDGFDLLTEEGALHSFRACEHDLEEVVYLAWVKRFVITVCVSEHDTHRVVSIVLRRAPRPLED